ncbi:MAG: TolC family protein [Sphingomonadales bacterium]
MFRILIAIVSALPGVVTSTAVRALEPLSLEDAVSIAISARDPTVTRFEERAAALDERAVSDSQLPDPKLRFELRNFPVDTFRLGQEPMTQIQVGLQQTFERGKTLAFTREQREAEAKAERAGLVLRERDIVLETRTTWLELFYWLGARTKVAESRQAVSELVEVATAIFATGRETSQDILRAELELSILDDRMVDVERQIEMARVGLARLIGWEPAQGPLQPSLPVLARPSPPDAVRDLLPRHPSVSIEDARIEARAREIDIARQQYKPGWSVNAGYGVRGGGRTDFATVGVSLDLPVFTGKRQDRKVAAAQRDRQAARLERDARLLDLNRVLDRTHADWSRLGDRVRLYRQVVIERAAETTDAALAAYRSGVSDFAELVRARLAELDAELTLLRLEVQRAQAQAQLLYFEGESR